MLKFASLLQLAADGRDWAFIVLPAPISAELPRRGRLTVRGHIGKQPVQVLLEPDGRKSHWIRIDGELFDTLQTQIGKQVSVTLEPVEEEPAPELPADFQAALRASPDATATWQATTNVAKVDWIHWMTSAKQARTREKRVAEAIDKLSGGQKRVCCFDPSGFYSKAFSAPKSAD